MYVTQFDNLYGFIDETVPHQIGKLLSTFFEYNFKFIIILNNKIKENRWCAFLFWMGCC